MITQLPLDILRHLSCEYLGLEDFVMFASVTKQLHQTLRHSKTVWWRLVECFLTKNPTVVASLKMNHKEPESIFRDLRFNTICHYTNIRGSPLFDRKNYCNDAFNDMTHKLIKHFYDDITMLLFQDKETRIYNYLRTAVIAKNFPIVKYICEYYEQHSEDNHYDLFRGEIQIAFVDSFENEDINAEILDYLLQKGASPTDYGSEDQTAIRNALTGSAGSVGNVRYLLDRIEAPHHDDFLEMAVCNSEYCGEIIELLIERGFRPSDIDLINSVSSCHLDLIPYLVSKGASLNKCEHALYKAIKARNIKIVRYLLTHGSRPDEQDMTYVYRNYGVPGSGKDPKTLKLFRLLHEFGVDVTKGDLTRVSTDVREYVRSLV